MLGGKVANKGAALTEFTLDTQSPMVAIEDVFDDGQAESSATETPGS